MTSPREMSISSARVSVTDWPADGNVEVTVERDDARDRRFASGRLHPDAVAGTHRAAGNLAGKAAKFVVGPVDPLHRKAEGASASIVVDRHVSRCSSSAGPSYQGMARCARDDVVALERRNGNGNDLEGRDAAGAKSGRELRDSRHRSFEDFLRIADEVHLVDGERRSCWMPSSETMKRVAPGLRQDALARIDQDDREVGGRSAGRHVAGVLFVARGVGDDELALVGGEEAVGDIDGDALFALGGKAVDQQREIDVFALRADLLASRVRAPRAGPRRSSSIRTAGGRSAWTCRRRRCRR